AAQQPPAILFQRIGRIDGRTKPTARTTVASGGLSSATLASPALSATLLQSASTGDLEPQRLPYLRVRSNLHHRVGLLRILHGLEAFAGAGVELHGLGQHHDKVLGCVQRFGIDAELSGVGQVVDDLELRLTGTQREDKGVTILLLLRNRRRIYGLTIRGLGQAGINLRPVRQVELKVLIVHLRARRVRSVLHGEDADALDLSVIRLEAHDVGGYADIVQFFGNIVNLDLHRRSSGRRHGMVRDTLVDGAKQVR